MPMLRLMDDNEANKVMTNIGEKEKKKKRTVDFEYPSPFHRRYFLVAICLFYGENFSLCWTKLKILSKQ